jgi:cyclase
MGVIGSSTMKVAIDTTSYVKFARLVKKAFDDQLPNPWRFVINTHSHFDHIGGNAVFGVPIIASRLTYNAMQEFTPKWLKERTANWVTNGLLDPNLLGNPRIALPDVLFERILFIRAGNLSLQVTRLGGHTSDSCIVFIPERRVLFAGDLVNNGRSASITEADRKEAIQTWLQALTAMMRLEPQVVVPGHGPPGGAELLTAQVDELEVLNNEGNQ